MGLIVFAVVLMLAIPQAAFLPLLDRDEPRFAEASREMIQSGDLIVPTFNHAPRYAKPPLVYWCHAISFKIFGETPLAARLPSLLATAGTALLLFIWGSQFGYKSIGLIAAFSYAFCLQTVQQGRVATADALLIFFMTLTGLAGWNLLFAIKSAAKPKDFRIWKWRLILGLAAGFLAKGPEAWLPLLSLFIIAPSGWRTFLKLFLWSLAIVAIWAMPAYIQTHGDYWRMGLSEGIGQRMVTGMQGHGASSFTGYLVSLPLYLLIFWLSALPWSLLLLIERKKLFAGVKIDEADRYLLTNVAIIFIVFSLMATKLPHYTLPAFPFIALFFARRWMMSGLSPWLPIKLTVGFGVVFAVIAFVFIPTAMLNHGSPSPVGELVLKAANQDALSPETEFAMVDFQEPNVVWEMRRIVKGYGQSIPEADVISFLGQPGPRAVVLSSALWKRIEATSPAAKPDWKIYETPGLNAAKVWDSSKHALALVDLTLVVKKGAAPSVDGDVLDQKR